LKITEGLLTNISDLKLLAETMIGPNRIEDGKSHHSSFLQNKLTERIVRIAEADGGAFTAINRPIRVTQVSSQNSGWIPHKSPKHKPGGWTFVNITASQTASPRKRRRRVQNTNGGAKEASQPKDNGCQDILEEVRNSSWQLDASGGVEGAPSSLQNDGTRPVSLNTTSALSSLAIRLGNSDQHINQNLDIPLNDVSLLQALGGVDSNDRQIDPTDSSRNSCEVQFDNTPGALGMPPNLFGQPCLTPANLPDAVGPFHINPSLKSSLEHASLPQFQPASPSQIETPHDLSQHQPCPTVIISCENSIVGGTIQMGLPNPEDDSWMEFMEDVTINNTQGATHGTC
jgi:hypothetical protein